MYIISNNIKAMDQKRDKLLQNEEYGIDDDKDSERLYTQQSLGQDYIDESE